MENGDCLPDDRWSCVTRVMSVDLASRAAQASARTASGAAEPPGPPPDCHASAAAGRLCVLTCALAVTLKSGLGCYSEVW